MENIIIATQVFINGNHGKQLGGCEVKMIPKMGQWCAGGKNLIGQQPNSNSSVSKLLVFIYNKKTAYERLL